MKLLHKEGRLLQIEFLFRIVGEEMSTLKILSGNKTDHANKNSISKSVPFQLKWDLKTIYLEVCLCNFNGIKNDILIGDY